MSRSNIISNLAYVFIIIAGLQLAGSLLIPLVLAAFIAMLLKPLVDWFNGKGVANWLSLSFTLILLVLCGSLVMVLLGSSVNQFVDNAPFYQQKLEALTRSFLNYAQTNGLYIDTEKVSEYIQPGAVFPFVSKALNSIGQVLTNSLMILFYVVFMLLENFNLKERLQGKFADIANRAQQIDVVGQKIKHYMKLKTLISLATGVCIWLSLLIIGVDFPLLWGTLAFMLNFIPTLGSLIAALPVVLLALIQLSPIHAVMTGGVYVIVNIVFGNVIEPKVMGKGLGLSPLIVLVSLVAWGWIWGVFGMLLSVPLTVILKIMLESNQQTGWIALLISADNER